MFWDILIPVITFILGIVVGGVSVSFAIKKQTNMMNSDPKQIQALARSMGKNLNQKQLNQISRQMQNSQTKKGKKKKNKK